MDSLALNKATLYFSNISRCVYLSDLVFLFFDEMNNRQFFHCDVPENREHIYEIVAKRLDIKWPNR